jgi:flagellin-specific chaperone FliS
MTRSILATTCWLVLFVLAPQYLRAEEPVAEFLQALRDKRLFDLADVYLDNMSTSPLVDDKFKERIPIERAENLIQSYSTTKNISIRLDRMAKAEAILAEFTAKTSNAELLSSANETLASLKFYKARSLLLLADSDRITEAEKVEKQKSARQLFLESIGLYDKIRLAMNDEIKRLTDMAKQNAKWAPILKRRRDAYTQILLRSPLIKQYSAETFPPNDPSREKLLTAAIQEYDQLAEDYASYGVSIDAILNASRCLNMLGKPAEAVKKLERIFNLENTMSLRPTRKAAGLVAIEAWVKVAPYPYREVIDSLEPLLGTLTKAEQREEEWAKIQLEVAKAYRAKAEDLRANKNGTPSDISRFNNQAALLAKRAARSTGPVRDDARKVLDEWNIQISDSEVETVEVSSFADAKELALESAIELDAKNLELNTETQNLTKAKPEEKTAIESKLAAAKTELVTAAKQVLLNVEQALKLAGNEISPEDQNHLRYLQGYAYYVQDRLFEPAIIGEFLLNRSPGVEWSRQAAGLAVRAYAKMYEKAPAEQREMELQKLTTLSERVVKVWPGSSEADNAATIMVRLALTNKDEAAVKKYSAMISQASGNQGAVGLKLAQNKWFEYKKAKKAMSNEEQQAKATELKSQVAQIVKDFQAGLNEVNRDNANFDACYSSLLLVDALLESGEIGQAVKQLEDSEVAPLDLIKQKHAAIFDSPNAKIYQQSAFRSAINVYLASMATGQDPQQLITKTQGVLNALRDLLDQGDKTEASKQITAIYGLIANELREQFNGIQDEAAKQNLAKNLATFLDSLATSSKDTGTIIWAAKTLQDTADALSGSGQPSATASQIYEKSTSTFERALQSDLSKLDQDPEQLKLELKRRKALATAGQGNYEEAIKQFTEILSSEKGGLGVQIDAARTLQRWGIVEKKAKPLGEAMMGTGSKLDPKTKRKSNTIWGWRAIFSATRGKEQFVEQFHETTLNLIESQFEYGTLLNRADAIEAAQKELANARQRDPNLGGPKFKSRYEQLEKRINPEKK